jgi:hypothetical protein
MVMPLKAEIPRLPPAATAFDPGELVGQRALPALQPRDLGSRPDLERNSIVARMRRSMRPAVMSRRPQL